MTELEPAELTTDRDAPAGLTEHYTGFPSRDLRSRHFHARDRRERDRHVPAGVSFGRQSPCRRPGKTLKNNDPGSWAGARVNKSCPAKTAGDVKCLQQIKDTIKIAREQASG
jgi:hypothetical protein